MARQRKYKKTGRYLFVDGYNIMNAWAEFSGMVEDRLEEARELLADRLEEFAATEHVFIILVFDAYRVKGGAESVIHRNHMDIVFTKETVTADRYIESELAGMGKVQEVIVATSDFVEQQIIMSRGGKRLSARELEILVKGAKHLTRKEARKIGDNRRLSAAIDDVNKQKLAWLRTQLEERGEE